MSNPDSYGCCADPWTGHCMLCGCSVPLTSKGKIVCFLGKTTPKKYNEEEEDTAEYELPEMSYDTEETYE